MTNSQFPLKLKEMSAFMLLAIMLITSMFPFGYRALAQNESVAAPLYQTANKIVSDANLNAFAQPYMNLGGPTWFASVAIDEDIKQFLNQQASTVKLLRKASRLPLGGFEVDPQEPQSLGELKSSARNLITIMILQARMDLLNHNDQQAVDDLLSCLAISNHIGQNAVSITKLVEIAVNQIATTSIAQQIPHLSKPALREFLSDLDELPSSSSPKEVFHNERNYSAKLMNQRKEVYPEESAKGILTYYDALVELMDLPKTEQATALEQLSIKYENHPMVKALVPMLDRLRNQMQLIGIRRAMLQAGVHVVLNGDDSLGTIMDPHDGNPFGYVKTKNGFLLSSRFEVRGKPVSLQFGN